MTKTIEAPPVTALPKPALKSPFQNRMLAGDLSSDLVRRLRIASAKVDLVAMDLHVERRGIYDLGDGTYITPSSELRMSKLLNTLDKKPRHIALGTEEHTQLYRRAARTFAKRLSMWDLTDRLFVVDAPWATHDSDGQLFGSYMGRTVEEISSEISALCSILESHGLQIVTLPEKYRIADAYHRWHREPYHFIKDATDWIAEKIQARVHNLPERSQK